MSNFTNMPMKKDRFFTGFILRMFFICFLAGGSDAFAQSPCSVLVSGHVTEHDTAIRIRQAIIHLKDDSGGMYETKTDTNGYYMFHFEKARFKNAEISCTVDKQVKSGRKMNECEHYIPSADKGLIGVSDSIRVFIKDFELTRSNGGCDYFPGFHFNQNSTVYRTGADKSYSHFDSVFADPNIALEFLVKTLADNPTIVIELSAHCSVEERSPDRLSQQRAEKVKADFIKAGIAGARLVAKGYGTKKLLVKPEIVDKAYDAAEKDILNAKNRRCVFKVISWDYPPTDKTQYNHK